MACVCSHRSCSSHDKDTMRRVVMMECAPWLIGAASSPDSGFATSVQFRMWNSGESQPRT